MKYYIYKIINKINGKAYVGQHKIPNKPETFKRYMGKGIAITAAIKKYGKENFEKIILENIEDDEEHHLTSEREIYWIKHENTLYPNGYNISPGGEGGCTKASAAKGLATKKLHGYKPTEETKKKISLAKKGKTFSSEHKKHLSDNHRFKTLHTVLFKNGAIFKTYDSIEIIGKKLGTTGSAIRRASEVLSFRAGAVVVDQIKDQSVFNHRYAAINSRGKVFENPLTKEKISPIEWRILRENNKELMKYSKHPYSEKYLKFREYFFDELYKLKAMTDSYTKIDLSKFKGVIYVEN